MDKIIFDACRAHTPQFDRLDAEIQKYAMDMMRSAITVAVSKLVIAARSSLDGGGNDALEQALEPFDELIPYNDMVEADISAAIDRSSK